MGPSLEGPGGFAAGVWVRAVLIGLFSLAAVVAGLHHLYATVLVLAGVTVVVGLDLARDAGAADRMLAQFVDTLAVEGPERPLSPPGLGQFAGAIDRAMERLGRARLQGRRRVDFAEALADSVVAALLVTDEAGAILHANRAAHRLLGEARGPLDGIPGLGLQTAARLKALAPGGRDIVRLADGQSMLATVTLFSTPGGGSFRLIALQSLAGDLDLVVLRSWQDLARVLAHEMLNSLTPICSLGDSLAARLRRPAGGAAEADEAALELAQAAEVIARRGAGLMDFVERYRRLADMPAAARTSIAMRDFLDALDRLMGPLMAGAGVDYASGVEPDDLIVDADMGLLEQAMINLVKNALDAVAGGAAPMIRVSSLVEDDHVVIAVEDNGPGLAGEAAETAFVPFFTTKAGGSGVGLTLARQIALAHEGRLEHVARAPNGAIFRLFLPRA